MGTSPPELAGQMRSPGTSGIRFKFSCGSGRRSSIVALFTESETVTNAGWKVTCYPGTEHVEQIIAEK